MSFDFEPYIAGFRAAFPWVGQEATPWAVTAGMAATIHGLIPLLEEQGDYVLADAVCVHRRAVVEAGAVVKPPAVIMAGCLVAAHAYLRGGVLLCPGVTIGPGCEVKSSLIMAESSLAHFNFVGDSILGRRVNLEAGAVIANHFNERDDRLIRVRDRGELRATGVTRFGALVGDQVRIGANAVLSPGVLLPRATIVGRLELVPPAAP